MDLFLLGLVLAMVGFGLLMVYSASFIYAQERTGDGFAFIKKQVIFAVLGCGLLLGAVRMQYRTWWKLALPCLAGVAALLVLVMIPGIGSRVGGAQRWLRLGDVGIQPAEIAKLALIIFVARQLDRKSDRLDRFVPGIVGNFIIPLPIFVLLMMQPDFGTTVITTLVMLLMMFLGGVRIKHLAMALGAAFVGGAILVLSSPYRLSRLMVFLDPWKDPKGEGFQILQSLVGLHHGSLWGVGLGNGKEKLFYLPEAHNDFIFAVIGEELGFFGILGVLVAFCYFIFLGLRIAWIAYSRYGDRFGYLLASGITLLLGVQALVNMSVVLGLVPTKGLALPFISYGGSAMLVNLFAVGILLSIGRAPSSILSPEKTT